MSGKIATANRANDAAKNSQDALREAQEKAQAQKNQRELNEHTIGGWLQNRLDDAQNLFTGGADYEVRRVEKKQQNYEKLQQKADKANTDAKGAIGNFTLKVVLPIVILIIVLALIVILFLKKRPLKSARIKAPVKSKPEPTVEKAESAESVKIEATPEDIKRLCEEKGVDYDNVMNECGSLDNAYYYLTTGRTSSFTPW